MNLNGKTALVTGSTSGIGLGIAKVLAQAGAQLVLNGFGDSSHARAEVAALGKIPGYHDADLRDVGQIEAMMRYAESEFGGVDIVINNAGIQHVAPVEQFAVEKWNDILAINLSSVFHTSRLALPGMRERNWGRIINIASVHGLVASKEKSAYVAAKHGVIGFSKTLALETARQLHVLRQASADELTQLITESMHSLSMPHGVFAIEVAFDERHLTADGADHIEFRVTTNPGQPLQPIAKVASGGELSRIALAIQVITARKMETPALIFDEVDVGISGPTAAVVGKLLRQLGESTQVMCVTHLPQVAGCGHHHFFVCKETDGEMTETHMQPLDKRSRLQELARLLGGSEVTRNTLANAKELLAA